jgi:predicted amidohydrolase YtcJ
MNAQRLGERLAHCNAYRTLLEAGIPMAFGSDCMPLDPLYGIRSAIEHPVTGERIAPRKARELYASAPRRLAGIHPAPASADLAVLSDVPESGTNWDALRVEAVFRLP